MKRIYYLLAVILLLVSCKDEDETAPSNLTYTPAVYKVIEEAGFTSSQPVVIGSKPFQFSLAENTDSQFTIDRQTGVISLNEGHTLATGAYSVDVTVSNKANTVTFTSAIQVEVGDIYIIDGTASPSELSYSTSQYRVEEGESFTSVAPTVKGDAPFSYLLANDYGYFKIDQQSGIISLNTEHALAIGDYRLSVIVENKAKAVTFENVLIVSISPALPASLSSKNYEMVWNDEFDGLSLDMTKWNYRYEGSARGYATVSRDNIELDGNGYLAVKTTGSDGNYYTGMIGTNGLFETTYGYFECRAKMQKSVGPHSSFWLQSSAYGKTDNPAADGAEIDIFEYLCNYPSTIYHTLHWNAYSSPSYGKNSQNVKRDNISKGFHTFGVEWTENGYTFYVDGEVTKTITDGISKRDQYIILSTTLAAWGGGGDNTNVETATTVNQWNFPDEIVFDYVRVFQIK